MRKVILATHHKMAAGMKDSIEFLFQMPEVYELSAYVDDTDIFLQIENIMKHVAKEDEVFILTDILGGSVTQQFVPYCSDKVHLICGMNLPLLLQLAVAGPEPLTPDDIHRMIGEAKNAMIYVNEYQPETSQEDE